MNMKYQKICVSCKNKFETNLSWQLYCTKKCKNKYKRVGSYKKVFKTEIRKCEYCNSDFEWSEKCPTQKYCNKKCREKAEYLRAKNRMYVHNCLNCNNIIKGKERKNDKFCCERCEKEHKIKNLENDLNLYLENNENEENIKDILYNIVFLKVSEIISKSNSTEAVVGFNNQIVDYWSISGIPENTRTFVLQRDNNECQICKNKENLHIHHIKKRVEGGNHNPDNLITLCSSCHRHIEVGDIELATIGCLNNVLKYYDVIENTPYITFNEIYNELTNISNLLFNNDIKEANSKLNFLLDKMDNDLL